MADHDRTGRPAAACGAPQPLLPPERAVPTGSNLLVALIVAQQASDDGQGPEWVRRGARILRLAIRLEGRVSRGTTLGAALEALNTHGNEEERAYLAALRTVYADSQQMPRKELRARDLSPGMVLDADVKTRDGARAAERWGTQRHSD